MSAAIHWSGAFLVAGPLALGLTIVLISRQPVAAPCVVAATPLLFVLGIALTIGLLMTALVTL